MHLSLEQLTVEYQGMLRIPCLLNNLRGIFPKNPREHTFPLSPFFLEAFLKLSPSPFPLNEEWRGFRGGNSPLGFTSYYLVQCQIGLIDWEWKKLKVFIWKYQVWKEKSYFRKKLSGDVEGMPFFDKILLKLILDTYKLVFSATNCKNMTFDKICNLTY